MEIEFKWKLPDDDTKKLITESSSVSEFIKTKKRVKMTSVYFDTADKQLKNRSIALRMRKENEKNVCYIKARVKDQNNLFVRNEFAYETDNVRQGIDYFSRLPEIRSLFTGIDLNDIRQTCVIDFERTILEIECFQKDKKFNAELCFDKGVGKKSDVEVPISEIELEFTNGNQELFYNYAMLFEKLFSLERENRSKIAQIN